LEASNLSRTGDAPDAGGCRPTRLPEEAEAQMADLQSDFVMSMAIVIAVAAVIILLFHRLKQPLILGYLIAGIICAPLVKSAQESVELLARLGIILLTFSIGLEFNFKKLRKIGIALIAAATIEIILMIGFGFQIGIALGWTTLEATLLGAILSVASTMIIVRSLMEFGKIDSERARLVLGILIVEDFAAVMVIAAASGIVSTGGVEPEQIASLLLKMVIFVAAMIVFGLAAVPALIDYVGKQRASELMTVTVLGLCFAMAYFARLVGFSEVIGSFVIGVIISESSYVGEVVKKIEPIRDLFGAIFFITVGMLVNLSLFTEIQDFVIPALVITVAFIAAKLFSCTLATFICGFGARNAFATGLGMVAVGEFSLMIASIAQTSDEVRETVYSIIVIVTTLTALVVPYSIKYTDRIIQSTRLRTPRPVMFLTSYLNLVVRTVRGRSKTSPRMSQEMRSNISSLFVNIVIVISVLALILNIAPRLEDYAYLVGDSPDLLLLIVILAGLFLIVPAMHGIWTRTIRFVEISTSEAMLMTKSAAFVGYQVTAKALKWALLCLYLLVGFVILAPMVHSFLEENTFFTLFAIGTMAVIIAALWNSMQTVNSKLCEVFEGRTTEKGTSGTSDELREVSEIIEAMEGSRR
jgi:monovalent cation:H+ antiporter-2, CPA2 family